MLVAQSITGGLRCSDVHPQASTLDWQAPYLFHQAIFGEGSPRLRPANSCCSEPFARWTRDRLRRVGSTNICDPISATRGIHPSRRTVEENPKTRASVQSLDRQHRALMKFLRRRDFFDRLQSVVDHGTRLGLRHMIDFEGRRRG